MTIHSSVLAWRTPWTEEPGGLCPWGCTELGTTEVTEHAWTALSTGSAAFPFAFHTPVTIQHPEGALNIYI